MKKRNYKEQERARPSGTHSLEVPLRTCSEYAPKDAPRMDTSFACSSSEQNISGVSREPLQRITLNRTARGVAARLGLPSSLPIAPTRTTPASTRESIAQSRRDGAGNFRGVGAIPSRTRDGAKQGRSGQGRRRERAERERTASGRGRDKRQQAYDSKGAAAEAGTGGERTFGQGAERGEAGNFGNATKEQVT